MSEGDNKVVLDPESEKTLVQRIVEAVRKPPEPPKTELPPPAPPTPSKVDLPEDEAAALADAISQVVDERLAEKSKPPEVKPPEEKKPPEETVESLKARLKELEARAPPSEAPKGQPPADRPVFSDLAEEIAAEIVADPQAGFSTLFRTMYDPNRKKKPKP